MDYGFIITRHVNSERTNKYWNKAVTCIRTFYPLKKIIIIDDNSNPQFLKSFYNYTNIEIINSEYNGRGELLPYYYFFQKKMFNNAVIIHDSVFIHRRFPFEKLIGKKVVPLWHFNQDKEEFEGRKFLADKLKNNYQITSQLANDNSLMFNEKWRGCFGVQSFINLQFLEYIENKHNIFKLLHFVTTKPDRCALERIFGVIFYLECNELKTRKSLFGDIQKYCTWGYTFENYISDIKNKKILPIVKVWTGR